ncbi:MAG: ABC transporter permease [Anaerolineae bacterium]|nr:ABC transporter permease [Anaerolineae bacterium]
MIRVVNIWFGLLGLKTSKVRSALTILGVIIGVAAVIVIVSLGNGMKRFTTQQLEDMTSGTIEVRPGGMMGPYMGSGRVEYSGPEGQVVRVIEGGGMMQPQRQPQLDEADVEALGRLATTVNGLSPQVEIIYAPAIYKGERMPSGRILGVTPEYLHVYKRELKYGRFVTAFDNAEAAPVVVIDEEMAKGVFGADVNPVGEIIHISHQNVPQNYTIIGVLAAKGPSWSPTGNSLILPLRTVRVRMKQEAGSGVDFIAARVDSRVSEERQYAVAQINTILAVRRGIEPGTMEDFQVRDTLAYMEEQNQIINIMTLVLSLIAGISLLVGSIGLMNIMLVSVSERTAEIGVRRAMGARQADILVQFLSEALLLSLVGGLIGFGLGVLGAQIVGNLIEELKGMVVVTADIITIAIAISSTVGVLSGIYPAWRAARLQPTEALRHI